jgi:cyclase
VTLAKRIIACLDVKNSRTVKGVKFEDLKDAGDAVELGAYYSQEGIDELVFLDIAATLEERATFAELVQGVASTLSIPFTVGGGIGSLADVERMLRSGADKVSINTAAIMNPDLISEVAKEFGSQCLVLAIDCKRVCGEAKVFSRAGQVETDWNLISWVKEVENLGVGEILLTSIEADGSKSGFDIELTALCSSAVNIPLIASGGAGEKEDFLQVFNEGKADAALAAGIFHFGELKVNELKDFLKLNNIQIR